MSCEDCHAAGDADWSVYATDSPRKQMARVMITMMATINKTHFRGRQVVTCYTCHRGSARPRATADLAELYGTRAVLAIRTPSSSRRPMRRRPTRFSTSTSRRSAARSASPRLRASWPRARAPGTDRRTNRARSRSILAQGSARRSFARPAETARRPTTARSGWIAAPFRPVAVLALSPQEVDGLKLEADLALPAGIKKALTNWRVGLSTVIDDREVQVVQGTTARGGTATLYFDAESGLLVRHVRYNDSPVGRISRQTDYSDYREVAGRQDAVQVDGYLAGRARYRGADRRAAERQHRRGEIREAGGAGGEVVHGLRPRPRTLARARCRRSVNRLRSRHAQDTDS